MKNLSLITFLSVFSGLSLLASDGASIKVAASSSLSLAIVDLDRNNPSSEKVFDTFKDSLSFELSQLCKMPTPIKGVVVDSHRAGWGLGTGTYDAVIVIGGKTPRGLISSGFNSIRATPASGDSKRMLSLVYRKDDPGLADLLEKSFPASLKNPFFHRALISYSGGDETKETDWTIAGLAN